VQRVIVASLERRLYKYDEKETKRKLKSIKKEIERFLVVVLRKE